jgi:hypothetical protein
LDLQQARFIHLETIESHKLVPPEL